MSTKKAPKNPPKKKGRPAPRPASAESAPPTSTEAAPSTEVRTEGQRRLIAVPGSHGVIALKAGVSKQVVSMWRQGKKAPASAARVKLASAYGIPLESWERAPSTDPIAPPPAPVVTADATVTNAVPADPEARSTLHHVLALITRLEAELETKGLSSTVRRGINADLTRALSLRARLEKEQELVEERIVLEHPFWKRIRSTLIATLAPHPDVARAVARALEAVGA